MPNATSYLQGAHDVRIDALTITHITGNAGRSAMEYLEDHIAIGAIHNSDERCNAPACFPETRVAVQEDIVSWITHGDEDDQPIRLMWISGPAGSGKTAIAGSVAETCYERDALAAGFFFSSYSPSPERSSKRYLVSTLVYQLLQHGALEVMEEHVGEAIRRDKAIFKKKLKDQFEALILKPLRRVKAQLGPNIPKVIIIDGVDEVKAERNEACDRHAAPRRDEDDHLEIIACLSRAAQDPAFPFRIVIISRPERVFTDFFSTQAWGVSKQLFLNDDYDPDSDIRLYLTSKFAELRRRYGLSALWPGEEVIGHIVERASGQFVYAATVIRFVGNGPSPPPIQLDALFPLRPIYENRSGHGLSSLDALYTEILMTSPNPKLAAQWIQCITPDTPAWVLRTFLESEPGQGEHILRPLASLISIPDLGKDREKPYRIYHKSLLDFLMNKNRCPADIYVKNGGSLAITGAWSRLTRRKAPVTPLMEPENKKYLGALADKNIVYYITCEIPRAFRRVSVSEEELLACDLFWWMGQVLGRGYHQRVSLHILDILESNHNICRKSQGPCRESCAKWSRDAFRAFVDHGWTIPSAELWQRYTAERKNGRCRDLWEEILSAFMPPHSG